MRYPMQRVCLDRHVAPGEFVCPLCSGLDACQALGNGELDGLVVAQLKMQEAMMLDGAPVAAVERVRTDEVQCAGDVAATALSHDEENPAGHRGARQTEELARQVRRSPLARAGVHIE